MFERVDTELDGVCILRPRLFEDSRGWFYETYHPEKFAALGIHDRFVQDNQSYSTKHVLRGLHYQVNHPQAKLCRVIHGEVLEVAVDVRYGSPTFGKWVSHVLSAENKHISYLTEGFAHGFVVLSEEAEFLYKCSDIYEPLGNAGVHWADPDLAIDWGVSNPRVSDKDARFPRLAEIPPERLGRYRP